MEEVLPGTPNKWTNRNTVIGGYEIKMNIYTQKKKFDKLHLHLHASWDWTKTKPPYKLKMFTSWLPVEVYANKLIVVRTRKKFQILCKRQRTLSLQVRGLMLTWFVHMPRSWCATKRFLKTPHGWRPPGKYPTLRKVFLLNESLTIGPTWPFFSDTGKDASICHRSHLPSSHDKFQTQPECFISIRKSPPQVPKVFLVSYRSSVSPSHYLSNSIFGTTTKAMLLRA